MDSLLEKWRLSIFRKPTTISSKIFRAFSRKRYSPYYFTQFKAKAKLYKFRKKLIKRRRWTFKKKFILRKKIHTARYRGYDKLLLSRKFKRTYRLPVVKGTSRFKKIKKHGSAKYPLKKRSKTKAKTRVVKSKHKFPNFIKRFKIKPKSTIVKTKQLRICKRKQRFNLITMSKIVSNKYKHLTKRIKPKVSSSSFDSNSKISTKRVFLKKIKQNRIKYKKHYNLSMLTIFFNKARKKKRRFALKHYKKLIRKKRRFWRLKIRKKKLKTQRASNLFGSKQYRNKRKIQHAKKLLAFPVSFYQFLLQSTKILSLPPSRKYFKLLKILIIMFRSVLQASFKKQFFYLTLFRQSLLAILTLPTFVPKFFIIRIITLLLLKEFSFKHTNIYYFQKIIASRYFIFQGAHQAIISSVNSFDKQEQMKVSFFGMHIGNLTASLTCNFIIYKLGQYFTIQEIFRLLLRDIKYSPNLSGFRILVAGVLLVKNVLLI